MIMVEPKGTLSVLPESLRFCCHGHGFLNLVSSRFSFELEIYNRKKKVEKSKTWYWFLICLIFILLILKYNIVNWYLSLCLKIIYFRIHQLSSCELKSNFYGESFETCPYFCHLKASCRRIFSLDLILSNAIGQTVTKEMEVNIFRR